MNCIYVKLFDNCSTTFNEEIISFPYNKVQALFYYLVVDKTTTRDELCSLLWSDMEENSAKKNLRNALYKLKECFMKEDILYLANNSTISLNSNIKIETDVDKFLGNKFEIDAYTGEFLKGYSVKNADNFERWIYSTREYLKGIYLKRLNERIKLEISKKNYGEIERYCKLIIKNDEFNEEAYKTLMICYKDQGKYVSAIKVYDDVSDILNKELSITPDIEIEKVFREVLNDINKRHNTDKTNAFFYGRAKEIKLIESTYKDFVENKESKSILIQGEMGIGKTRLKDKFIQSISKEDIYISEVNCYQFEDEYSLKPWKKCIIDLVNIAKEDNADFPILLQSILSKFIPEIDEESFENLKLETAINLLKQDVFTDSIGDILKRIGNNKKILIVFEDIQWMDSVSITLLSSLICNLNKDNIMFLLTCRNEFNSSIDKLLISTSKYNKIEKIELNRFSNQDVKSFINKAIPDNNISTEMINKIYLETEGNTFFLTEYLSIINSPKGINIMTSKMQDVLKSRFVDMSNDEKKIVEIVSLFDDVAPISIISQLTQIDEFEIIDIIEELEKKCILEETSKGSKVYLKFTHRKLREFIHRGLSQIRKNILHNKVGKIIEKSIKNDSENINLYFKLIYHYKNANNNIDCLKYKVKSLNVTLNFIHERFPRIYHDDEFYNKLYYDENITTKKLDEIEQELIELKAVEGDCYNTQELEIYVLHIKGRYLIRKGQYFEGLKCIEDMIDMAMEINLNDYIIEGYKQMICYCIQTNNTKEMIKYVNYGFKLIEDYKIDSEKVAFLRFKALYKIMVGEYETGENLMMECIESLRKNKKVLNQYILYIAACYNDIGNIKMNLQNYEEALEYYKKSIEICEEKNIWISISLFQTNAGVAAYYLNDYNMARYYLKKALNIYKKIAYNSGESIAESYMSLISYKEEKFKESLKYLKSADTKSNVLKNPKEIGTVLLVKSKIKANMECNNKIDDIFKDYLNEDLEVYVNKGSKCLKESKEEYKFSC
ncbi:AAA family ATPase [Terrisporobacter petrolearius]|uniref:AAA family ATPase n=1 Tax=Terrisporobacter petrolearius TaxID=1460447 RepID=UPI0031CC8C72